MPTINGDFQGTRWQTMKSTVDLICSRTIDSNIENSIGLISIKHKSTEIILNLSGKRRWNTSLSEAELNYGEGNIHIDTAIRKARLALKHKKNPKQTRRIILLIASPIKTDKKTLVRIAKDLKKNKLSLDIICFGVSKNDENRTVEKLNEMVEACSRGHNCHFIHLENEKKKTLRDVLIKSRILDKTENVRENFNQTERLDGFPNIDPQTDPELYYAIRLSIEMADQEEKERIKAEKAVDKEEKSDLEETIKKKKIQDLQEHKEVYKNVQNPKDSSLKQSGKEEAFLSQLMKDLPGVKEKEIDLDDLLNNLQNKETEKKNHKKK